MMIRGLTQLGALTTTKRHKSYYLYQPSTFKHLQFSNPHDRYVQQTD